MMRDWHILTFEPPFRGSHGGRHRVNLARPLPLPDSAFTAIYARRIIEHLDLEEGNRLIGELARIAAPGAVVRISTPDLEEVVRSYLVALEASRSDSSSDSQTRHQELLLELVDQMVRQRPGGELAGYIVSGQYAPERLRQRWGDALADLAQSGTVPRGVRLWALWLRRAAWQCMWGDPRRSREAHAWMYGAFSLTELCQRHGLVDVMARRYDSSRIEDWSRCQPDTSTRGDYPFEPSLFIEARKSSELKAIT